MEGQYKVLTYISGFVEKESKGWFTETTIHYENFVFVLSNKVTIKEIENQKDQLLVEGKALDNITTRRCTISRDKFNELLYSNSIVLMKGDKSNEIISGCLWFLD